LSSTPVRGAITVQVDGKAHEPQQAFDVELTVFHFVGDACHFVTSTTDIPKQLQHKSITVVSADVDEPRVVTIDLPCDGAIDLIVVVATAQQMAAPCRCPCKTQRLGTPVLHNISFAYSGMTTKHLEFAKAEEVRCVRLLTLTKTPNGWYLEECGDAAPQFLEVAEHLGISLLT
jgi:hypothetical protein